MIVKLLLVFEIMLVNLYHQDYEPILFFVNGFDPKGSIFCFLNELLICARFLIYRYKYSKSNPDMLQYFNLINLGKKLEYIIAKQNNKLCVHFKKSKLL